MFRKCKVIRIGILGVMRGVEERMMGKAKKNKIINPFFDEFDAQTVPDVDRGISYLALKAGGRSESKRDIMIDEKLVAELNNKKTFVIGHDRDCTICSFHV